MARISISSLKYKLKSRKFIKSTIVPTVFFIAVLVLIVIFHYGIFHLPKVVNFGLAWHEHKVWSILLGVFTLFIVYICYSNIPIRWIASFIWLVFLSAFFYGIYPSSKKEKSTKETELATQDSIRKAKADARSFRDEDSDKVEQPATDEPKKVISVKDTTFRKHSIKEVSDSIQKAFEEYSRQKKEYVKSERKRIADSLRQAVMENNIACLNANAIAKKRKLDSTAEVAINQIRTAALKNSEGICCEITRKAMTSNATAWTPPSKKRREKCVVVQNDKIHWISPRHY